MREAFVQFINEKRLCNKTDKILAAVSGGIDSVVLLNLFIKTGFRIGVAHCNYELRGVESQEDELFVRELAIKYNLPLHTKVCNAVKYASANRCSIQEAARNLRYQWFEELCLKKGYTKIALAHHADDQIETFFINLLRGSGVSGLKGMPVMRGKIIRPLLFANREEIDSYATANDIDFREDSSNQSVRYLRNQIRHLILPELDNNIQDYRKRIGKSIQYLQDDFRLLQFLLDTLKSDLLISEGENTISISLSKLKKFSGKIPLLFYLLKDFGFNYENVKSIEESMMKKNTGAVFYGIGYQLLVDRKALVIRKEEHIKEHSFIIDFVGDGLDGPIQVKTEKLEQFDYEAMNPNPAYAYFDFKKIQFPLTIRKWREGDRFSPLGIKGSKLISDFLIDKKVDKFAKEKIFVMESNAEIIWVIGMRISNKYKVERYTKEVLLARYIS